MMTTNSQYHQLVTKNMSRMKTAEKMDSVETWLLTVRQAKRTRWLFETSRTQAKICMSKDTKAVSYSGITYLLYKKVSITSGNL